MFAVGREVNGEVFVSARRGDVVVLDQAFDFRFRDSGNLAFIRVESGEAFSRRAASTDGAKRFNQIFGFVPLFSRLRVGFRNAETFRELEPKLRMIRRAGFFVDQVVEELTAGRLVLAIGVNSREISRERRGVM